MSRRRVAVDGMVLVVVVAKTMMVARHRSYRAGPLIDTRICVPKYSYLILAVSTYFGMNNVNTYENV